MQLLFLLALFAFFSGKGRPGCSLERTGKTDKFGQYLASTLISAEGLGISPPSKSLTFLQDS